MDVSTAKIAALVTEAQSGNREAMGQLFDLLHTRVYRFFAIRTSTREIAEDLTQTTFIEMIQALPRYKVQTGAKFTTWLFQIARFRLIDHYRTNGRTVTVETFPDIPDEAEPSDPVANEAIDRALRELPEQYQTVLHLRFREGWKASEIAGVLKTNALNVRVLQHRALAALRKRLPKDYDAA